jgi:hypothetical protein
MNEPSRVISDAYLEQQQKLHENPRYGRASLSYAPLVASVLRLGHCASLSDYGAGKCKLREGLEAAGVRDLAYQPYDPAFPEYGTPKPADMVACVDVLEHIEPELLDGVLDELAGITAKLGLFTVHTGPAKKILSDGRNAHIIQEPARWWLPRLAERFEIVHVQTVPKGFWVLVAAKARGPELLAALDPFELADAAARHFPGRKGALSRVAKAAKRALGLAKD